MTLKETVASLQLSPNKLRTDGDENRVLNSDFRKINFDY